LSPGSGVHHGRVDLGATQQLVHAALARAVDERHDGALLARATGAAGAVQVRLVLVRRIRLDHQGDVVDVDAASRDIRCHQHVDATAGQHLQVAGTARLVEVAVQRRGRDAGIVEHVGELLGERAGAGEDQGLAVACGELLDDRTLVALLDEQHLVVDRRRRLVFAGNLVHGRVDQELLDQRGNTLVEGCGEEQLLAALASSRCRMRCTGSRNPRSHMWSASSSTVTDHLAEVEATLLDEVLDAAGGGDDDVHSALKRRDLLCTAERRRRSSW
jgi:hypothetical protein